MKRIVYLTTMVVALFFGGCEKYDDSALTNRIDNLEERVRTLEELCRQMNTNISSLQTIVSALQSNDYVTGVAPITKNGETIGYTITFTKSQPITIYHGENGKDGQNGTNGTNGVDGKDGSTPVIGVKMDDDGIYYWTLNGEWLTDENGNKIKAVGTDGKDGQDGANGADGEDGADGKDGQNGADGKDGQNGINGADGKDGITPQLKIEEGYWFISYDNGATWTQLGKATGEDGKDGANGQDGTNGTNGTNGVDGDSFFQSVDTSNQEYVVFTLADGTEIQLPTWYAFEQLRTLCNQMNSNISALQSIVEALQNNDYVTSVSPITENGTTIGYTIYFSKSNPITIYHGKDGKDGQNGTNGVDGKDGSTPVIGVKMDDDGVYYWTLNGEWLTDKNGNKIKAVGTDGKDGANGANGENGTHGKDGITPQLKIEDGYWLISYDNGATWTQLGKATGEDGAQGPQGEQGMQGPQGEQGNDGAQGPQGEAGINGDSFFQSVDTSNQEYVVFTLADGTEIQLPTWYAFEQLRTLCNQMNSNIEALQSIVAALQNNDYVTSVVPVLDNGKTIGYTINFSKSNPVTIYHGKDGQNGQNGTNGVDGKDGSTPVIGVKMDDDGIYYWTLNGEWLTDENGNKIKAIGTDGKDGANGADGEDGKDGQNGTNGTDGKDGQNGINGADGKDGITPQLKIEEGYWFISYDNGATWTQLGKATGEDGAQGPQGEQGMQGPQGEQGNDGAQGPQGEAGINGDSFFQSVTQDENNVYIVLADGTEITIPKKINLDDVKLTYIPRYDDGKATVIYSYKSDSYVELDFEVSPASKAADWSDITTVKAVYTESRAGVEFVDMDIMSWSTDATNGTISIKASGKNLSDDFFDGNQSASVRIAIENDDINIISEYIPIVTKKIIVPNNEIWYTATEQVTPYATDVFGATYLPEQSTYDSETQKGILVFDGDVTAIGKYAFRFNQSLTKVIIPDCVSYIGAGAFSSCSNLSVVSLGQHVEIIDNYAFANSSLTYIALTNCVKTVNDYAFQGCEKLESVIIPASIEKFGVKVFQDSKSISNVYYLSDIEDWCYITFSDATSTPLWNGANLYIENNLLTDVVIPIEVTMVNNFIFYGCTSLESVTMHSNISSIGEGAFYGTGIESVTIPNSVQTIGKWAFQNCEDLNNVNLGNNVIFIDTYAFGHCSKLTTITLPQSLEKIGLYVFYKCTNLSSVYCRPTTPPIPQGNASELKYWCCFDYTSANLQIFVPAESETLYKKTLRWENYEDKIVGYNYAE